MAIWLHTTNRAEAMCVCSGVIHKWWTMGLYSQHHKERQRHGRHVAFHFLPFFLRLTHEFWENTACECFPLLDLRKAFLNKGSPLSLSVAFARTASRSDIDTQARKHIQVCHFFTASFSLLLSLPNMRQHCLTEAEWVRGLFIALGSISNERSIKHHERGVVNEWTYIRVRCLVGYAMGLSNRNGWFVSKDISYAAQ